MGDDDAVSSVYERRPRDFERHAAVDALVAAPQGRRRPGALHLVS